jgi:cystine transport system substrate-binding protein
LACALATSIATAPMNAFAAPAAGLPAHVVSSGKLTVGLEGTYPPFNYQDDSGHLVGFEVDFANALAQRLGVAADFKPGKWDGLLAAVQSDRIDVVINQVTITPEREKTFDFSEPYTISGIQIITRKADVTKYETPASLAGAKVGVGLGTNYQQWLQQNEPKAIVETYDDDPTKYADLAAGRIDAVLNDRLVAADYIKKSGLPFAAAGAPFAKQDAGIALKQDPAFQTALNTAIDSLRADGTLKAISVKWFGTDVTQ